jgi:hypothetical protein
MSDRGAIEPLDLAIGVMGLLHEGRRTATYKLAALSALIDYCDQIVDRAVTGSVEVPIDALSERVISIYWRQVEGVDGSTAVWNLRQVRRLLIEQPSHPAVGHFRDLQYDGRRSPTG